MIGKIIKFVREAIAELRAVNWPSRSRATRYSAIVITVSIAFAIFLGILDFIFGAVIKRLI